MPDSLHFHNQLESLWGANIGTTVTAWIISALGFKVDIAAMALPFIWLLAYPYYFQERVTVNPDWRIYIRFLFFVYGPLSLEDECS